MENIAPFGGGDKSSAQLSGVNPGRHEEAGDASAAFSTASASAEKVFASALQGAARQADNAARCLTFAVLILDDAGLEFWDGAVEVVERVHDLASHLAIIAAETAAREVCRREGGGR